ncbi:MAG TPA: ribulose-phosphate 3-epimerase [Actinomycetota bacterium]|nr:ribulose-phosphate 3-epimerase [Actinomycetota bacterium]
MTPELAPSILSADFSRLAEQVASVEPYAGRIHVDVMDGHFVPNLTMGPVVVASIRPHTRIPIEVHLMVTDPAMFIDSFAAAGADRIIFHVEVGEDPDSVIDKIVGTRTGVGIALNPQTSFDLVEQYMRRIDLVTIMTVNPGFGGQSFMHEVIPKIEQARKVSDRLGGKVQIEVDGGVDSSTIEAARSAGADVFVAGNAIFGAEDPVLAARSLARMLGLEHA